MHFHEQLSMCALVSGIHSYICELAELVLGFSDPSLACALVVPAGQITPNIAGRLGGFPRLGLQIRSNI